jgi:hypothetical protein
VVERRGRTWYALAELEQLLPIGKFTVQEFHATFEDWVAKE